MTPDTPDGVMAAVFADLAETAARADAAQRLALTAIEMLFQTKAEMGERWDLVAEADRIEVAPDNADSIERRGRVIAAALLRVQADLLATGRPTR